MPFNFRLNLQHIFRSLGIQTEAQLPELNDNVQMTMLLTDLSKLVPAPVEPRGLAGVNLPGSVGNTSVCQLQSLAPGGIFIENILFRSDGFPPSENFVLDVTAGDFGLAASPGNINVGGSPLDSVFTADEIPVAVTGVPIPATDGKTQSIFTSGIFVPNQAFFAVASLTFNKRLDVAMIYRELPAVEDVDTS